MATSPAAPTFCTQRGVSFLPKNGVTRNIAVETSIRALREDSKAPLRKLPRNKKKGGR